MKQVTLHPHAKERLMERGATMAEVVHTVRHGVSSPAKFGRTRFVHTFTYNRKWLGRRYAKKQVEAFAEPEPDGNWLVVTLIVKFY
jgi:hypothetical protein